MAQFGSIESPRIHKKILIKDFAVRNNNLIAKQIKENKIKEHEIF